MKVLILIKMMNSSVAALIKSLWNSKFKSYISSMQSQNLDFNFTVNQPSRKNWIVKIKNLKIHIQKSFEYVQCFTYQYLCVLAAYARNWEEETQTSQT